MIFRSINIAIYLARFRYLAWFLLRLLFHGNYSWSLYLNYLFRHHLEALLHIKACLRWCYNHLGTAFLRKSLDSILIDLNISLAFCSHAYHNHPLLIFPEYFYAYFCFRTSLNQNLAISCVLIQVISKRTNTPSAALHFKTVTL